MVECNQQTNEVVGVLQRRVARFLSERQLAHPGDLGVIALSGGPDSLCLLHVLLRLKENLGLRLVVAHLNHGLRGIEGDEDAEFVSRTASSFGVPSVIEKRDVSGYKAENNLSWEDAARRVRYQFLAEAAASYGARWVALGHTADDQSETVLLHLLRGSGIYGLKGMDPVADWPYPSQTTAVKLIRPLLEVSRADTHSYCAATALHPRFDTSNLSQFYTRNRVREDLLPKLQEYNPRVGEALLRTARAALELTELLDWALEPLWPSLLEEVALRPGPSTGLRTSSGQALRHGSRHGESPSETGQASAIRLNAPAISKLPVALQVHVLRRAITQALGDLQGITGAHLEAATRALAGRAGVRLDLPRGLTLTKEYDYAILRVGEHETDVLPRLEGEQRIVVPGETLLPGWRIITRIEGQEGAPAASGRWQARLDYAATGSDIVVRGRRHGDRFHPHGMEGRKKVQDFMVDAHIPRTLRDRVPIFVSGNGIIWLAGWRVDHDARVTPDTQNVLFIDMLRDA